VSDGRDILDTLRALENAPAIAVDVARRAGTKIESTESRSLAAGVSPEGPGWAPRKAGGRAYAHAASHVEVRVLATMIRVTLRGPEVYGHFGARGMPVRQMIPDAGAGIPASVARALDEASDEACGSIVR
jgi:hypothetical protein